MSTRYIAFVVPVFLILICIEYWVAKKKKRTEIYKFSSTLSNISIGIAERLLSLFISAFFYGVFLYIYENYRIMTIPNHWSVWLLLLLATDFVWYWYHRLGHEVNLLWGAHVVHHQSEEYNYSVSARVTTLQAIIRNIFWCSLPLLGFHPTLIIAVSVFHAAYSFFTHTQLIGKLGWLENILITPSHHRVHHASNEIYLNKNYGDVFVFWDKLFGTFETEDITPHYGLTHPLKSHSFIWQHFHYYTELYFMVKKTKGLKAKLKVLFGAPELLDPLLRPSIEEKVLPKKVYFNTTVRYKIYLIFQVGLCLLLLFLISLFFSDLPAYEKIVGSLFILLTLINCGALMEQRNWNYHIEYIRILLLIVYISLKFESPLLLIVSISSILLVASQEQVKKWYYQFVYNQNEQSIG